MNENKKAKKVVALLLCAVLLVVGSVSATLAYLTSTATVTNTFTVGKVAITLDEAVVDEYGVGQGGRSETGFTYKLIPGHEYVKDPIVHVDADSESCFVFVQIDNEISAYEDSSATIHEQIIANLWTQGDGSSIPTDVYYKEYIKDHTDKDLKVFEKFTIDKNANKVSGWDTINSSTVITIKAYAIQKDGLDVNTAWGALNTP